MFRLVPELARRQVQVGMMSEDQLSRPEAEIFLNTYLNHIENHTTGFDSNLQ